MSSSVVNSANSKRQQIYTAGHNTRQFYITLTVANINPTKNFRHKRSTPTNHSSSKNYAKCAFVRDKNLIRSFFHCVKIQVFDRQTNRQTDRRTDVQRDRQNSHLYTASEFHRLRLHSMQRGINQWWKAESWDNIQRFSKLHGFDDFKRVG